MKFQSRLSQICLSALPNLEEDQALLVVLIVATLLPTKDSGYARSPHSVSDGSQMGLGAGKCVFEPTKV